MIRGTKKALEKRPSVDVNINASIHNRFDIEVVDAKTGEVKQKAQAFNVICDNFWTKLNDQKVYNLEFGGGTGTPSASDRALFSYIGRKAAASSGVVFKANKEERWISAQHKIALSESEYVGKTLTEVGFSDLSGVLTTHAMLQDMNGNPISILKTDMDIINIYGTIFFHWADSYADGGIIPYFANFENGHSIARSFVSGYGITFGNKLYFERGAKLSTSSESYGIAANTNISQSYNSSEKKATITATRVLLTSANVAGGTLWLAFGSSLNQKFCLPILVDCGKAIAHSVINGEAVATGDGSTADFATKFSPAYDVEVYVDGVLASDVTVDENVPTNFYNIMGTCFVPIAEATDVLPSVKYAGFPVLNDAQNENNLSRMVVYNPYWEKGITTIVPHNPGVYPMKIEVSNDLSGWTTLWDGTAPNPNLTIPAEHQDSKYFAFSGSNVKNIIARDIQPTNIHFATPPAAGSVITANYKAKCIAKDENHVFDFSMSITFGEYTEN